MATFQLYRDQLREYRWRLLAANGEIIADSGEGYTQKPKAQSGIDFVKKYAAGAGEKDLT